MEEQSREVETPPPLLDGEFHLLSGDLKDDLYSYRRREAAWISIVVHGVIVLALILMPKWLPQSALIIPAHERDNATMVILPEDQLKVQTPKTNIISDKDRLAQSRTPTPIKAPPPKVLDARTPGPAKPISPPPQPPGAQAMQASPGQAQAGQQAAAQPPAPTQTGQLEAPRPKQHPFAIASAGSTVDQAIRSAANDRPIPRESFGGGEMGSGFRPRINTRGAIDILSDTRGVDFGPYMKRVKVTTEDHWYPLIPEVALPPMMKRGKVVIDFFIMKDGTIQGLAVVGPSGDLALDRAAYGALLNAVPLPRLPKEFSGDYIKVRVTFFYNPDKADLE